MFCVHSLLHTSQSGQWISNTGCSLKKKASRLERWEGRITKGNVDNQELRVDGSQVSAETPMQNAFLVLELRKHHPPLSYSLFHLGAIHEPDKLCPWPHLNLRAGASDLTPTSPNLTYPVSPVTPSRMEMTGLLTKHTAAVLNLGSPGKIQEVCEHLGLHATLWVFMCLVHFPGESTHHFITSLNGSLTWKKLKDCDIKSLNWKHTQKGQVLSLSEV